MTFRNKAEWPDWFGDLCIDEMFGSVLPPGKGEVE